jgi:tetratricopeptide (TPR) repeat protein
MKKNGILVIGAAFALVLAMFVGCGGRTGQKEYAKAVKAWEKGNLVQARTLFEKAAARLSGNAGKSSAFNKLGIVLWQLDELQAAADAFSEACALSETITDASLNLALAQFHSGDFDGATKSINMYLGENPNSSTALAVKSLIAAQNRDWVLSSRLMTEVAAGSPNDPAAQNALALTELNQGGNSARAIDRLKNVTAAFPDYAPAWFNLAVIHDQWLREKTAALDYYQAYLRQAGDSGRRVEAARQAVERLSENPDAPPATTDPALAVRHMKEGARLHGEGKFDDAVGQFRMAVEADPNQKNAYYNMALSHYSLKQYDETAQACRAALAIDPRFADARYMLALSYVQVESWDDAEREARELSALDAKRGKELLSFIAGARK